MPTGTIVVIGASAGGVEALRSLVAGLPAAFPAAVLVVLHLPRAGRSALPAILTRAGPLPASHAVDGQRLEPGEILVAPPNHHLTIDGQVVRLTHGPTENGHRPAVDPLFRTAARWHGRSVVGVILSGTLDDGTAGAIAIARRGGAIVVQDPRDALYAGMPSSVLEHVAADHVGPASGLGEVLARLCSVDDDPAEGGESVELEDVDAHATADISGLGCPQCGGSLRAIPDGTLIRYRCRVGHAWSPESLLAEQSQALESALWMALRTLEDRVAVCRRCEDSAIERGFDRTAERYRGEAAEAEAAARLMRRALEQAQGDQQSDAVGRRRLG